MDDRLIDRYITQQIRKRGITLYDIIGGEYIDPDPENKDQMPHERARYNKFSCPSGDLRLCELLNEGEFDPYDPYKNLAIPIKDLVRYWWDNLADQEAIIEDAFDAILTVYKDRLLPEEKEEEVVDFSDDFDEVYSW